MYLERQQWRFEYGRVGADEKIRQHTPPFPAPAPIGLPRPAVCRYRPSSIILKFLH